MCTSFCSTFVMYVCILFTTVADVLNALHHVSVCAHVAGYVIVSLCLRNGNDLPPKISL